MRGKNVRLIDLSGEIFQKCPTLPNHPPVTFSAYQTHDTVREVDGVEFSCASSFLTLGEHTASHVDAPCHFDERETAQSVDQMPLENFYRPALCLDLSHKPLKSDISISDLQEAEAKTGETINSGDIVLLYMAHYDRTFGSPEFLTNFPGLTKESAQWLGRKKITSFGVEAVSPGRPGKNNFEVHLVCRDMGFTHMEGLANLHQVIGLGHFQFAGFPLKIRGGTGSPIRAVAIIDET